MHRSILLLLRGALSCLLLSALPAAAQTRWISTIEIMPLGVGSLAGIAVDATGNIYSADALTSVIRKTPPEGILATVFAGNVGVHGSADGTGSSASFSAPHGLAVDSAGNVYVADTGNHTIRKITPGGTVTTIAGIAGSAGDTDGPITSATFNKPTALDLDAAGNLYVADFGNQAVRKISQEGIVSTVALTANGGFPTGIALDGSGNIYVSEGPLLDFPYGGMPNAVDKIAPDGTIRTLAGQAEPGSADGSGSAAQFTQPLGLAVDTSGNVLVADSANRTIREITPAGVVTTVAGNAGVGTPGPVDGLGGQALFGGPSAVAVGADGNLYVADATGIRRGVLAANTQGPIRFTNLSARGTVSNSSPLVAGFIVQGTATQTVLVRAVGPTLANFGISNFLHDPLLQIYNGTGQSIASSADGQNNENINSAVKLVGTFPFSSYLGSDVGIVMTLQPGAYTASVTSLSGSTGTVLLEAYEVP